MQKENFWNSAQQRLLNGEWCATWCQPSAVCQTENMRIDSYGGLSKSDIEHHVGSFAADPGQAFKRFSRVWHAALVLIEQDLTGLQKVARFAVIQTNAFDVSFQTRQSQFEDLLGRVGQLKKCQCGLVDTDISGLR